MNKKDRDEDESKKGEEYWKEKLTPNQYKILRQAHTEKPFSGKLLYNKQTGMYVCAACKFPLFSSDTKFDSGLGWPSFYDVVDRGNVKLADDLSLGMKRIEVKCSNCDSHLGHLFDDGPNDTTGLRYCINSLALEFKNSSIKTS